MVFKLGVLKNFAVFNEKHLCRSLEIFKNTFFYRTSPVAASIYFYKKLHHLSLHGPKYVSGHMNALI